MLRTRSALFTLLLGLSQAAFAATPPAQQGSAGGTLFMLGVFIFMLYFMIWRPQAKRQKAHQNLVSQIKKGDEVISSGGILGKVSRIDEQFVVLSLNGNTSITLQKTAISKLMPKGTLEAVNK